MKTFFGFFLMAAILIASKAGATEIFENYISARAMGMGNAYSAVVDDQYALFYNPAGLDKIHGLHLTLLTPQLGTDALNAFQIYQDSIGSNYSTIIHNYYGKTVWAGIHDSVGVSMHDFALIAYDTFNLSFNLHNPAYPNLTMSMTNDVGLVGGLAASLLPNEAFVVGAAVKRITRYGGRVPFGPSTLASLSNSQLTALINNTGTGYGLDAGILITLPAPSKPTFSAVWKDIGQTKFNPISGNAPPPLDNEPTAGFSMEFGGSLLRFRPAFEYKHINRYDEQLGKLMHFGGELQLAGGLSIRAGANQGYYTAGVGLDLSYIKIDAASYAVELDTYPGQLEDRRYILQVTIDLNFDPSFDFFKGGGKNGSGSNSGSGAYSPGFQRR